MVRIGQDQAHDAGQYPRWPAKNIPRVNLPYPHSVDLKSYRSVTRAPHVQYPARVRVQPDAASPDRRAVFGKLHSQIDWLARMY